MDAVTLAAAQAAAKKQFAPAVTPQPFGAKGDGTTDDTTALRAWLASGAKSLLLPAGTYVITGTLTQTVGVSVTFARGAVVKAGAAIAGPMWDTPVASLVTRVGLYGGNFDCNQLADNGVYLRYFQHFYLHDLTVTSAASHSIIIGDTAAATWSWECMISNFTVHRPQGQTVPVGSNGLWLNNVTDCEIQGGIVVGANIGVRVEKGGHKTSHVHVWGYTQPSICFDDNASGNIWIGCYADTPSLYGFRLRKWGAVLLGCRGYLNSSATDNTVKGIQVDTASAGAVVYGMTFDSVDVSHRWQTDYAGNISGSTFRDTIENVTYTTVAAPASLPQLIKGKNSQALNLSGLKQYFNWNTNDSGFAYQQVNGAPLQGYSDGYTTETLRLETSTGGISPGTPAGKGQPIYSGSGAPTIAGTVGAYYLRTDTPATAGQRIYVCTVAGAAGAATWIATAA